MKLRKAIYGTVAIHRARCPRCRGMSLIIQGNFACCGLRLPEEDHTETLDRMCETLDRRHYQFPARLKREVLQKQNNACLYCGRSFDEPVWNDAHSRYELPKIQWDHFIPISAWGGRASDNAVAACSECNEAKSDRVFGSVEEARVAILISRRIA